MKDIPVIDLTSVNNSSLIGLPPFTAPRGGSFTAEAPSKRTVQAYSHLPDHPSFFKQPMSAGFRTPPDHVDQLGGWYVDDRREDSSKVSRILRGASAGKVKRSLPWGTPKRHRPSSFTPASSSSHNRKRRAMDNLDTGSSPDPSCRFTNYNASSPVPETPIASLKRRRVDSDSHGSTTDTVPAPFSDRKNATSITPSALHTSTGFFGRQARRQHRGTPALTLADNSPTEEIYGTLTQAQNILENLNTKLVQSMTQLAKRVNGLDEEVKEVKGQNARLWNFITESIVMSEERTNLAIEDFRTEQRKFIDASGRLENGRQNPVLGDQHGSAVYEQPGRVPSAFHGPGNRRGRNF